MSETIYHYPNKMGRIILLGMEEVIGKGGLDAVLNIASMDDLVVSHSSAVNERTFSFETVSQLHLALERVYGPRGGEGWRCELDVPASNMGSRSTVPSLG
ncbi:MAG: hypothetical protein IPJ47_04740 [Anaerolineales bacterium]|nr:hypothetical protein [Anaerolineales bacterium]